MADNAEAATLLKINKLFWIVAVVHILDLSFVSINFFILIPPFLLSKILLHSVNINVITKSIIRRLAVGIVSPCIASQCVLQIL